MAPSANRRADEPPPPQQRAFLANYQTVGYLEDGVLVDPVSGKELPADEKGKQLLDEAISYYQAASEAYRSGILRRP